MSVIGQAPYIDASTLAYRTAPRQLTFRYRQPYGAANYVMLLPDDVWRKIPDKRPAELAQRLLVRGEKQEIITFVDDMPVAVHSVFPVSQSFKGPRNACRVSPDGTPRRTMDFMIISPSHAAK